MRSAVHIWQDLVLMTARIGLGLLMVVHGWHRYRVGVGPQVEVLTQAGVPQPKLLAWGSIVLELGGGVLMVFGLLVPLVALTYLVQNVLVAVWLKGSNGFLVTHDGWEYNAVLAGISLVFLGFGSGRAGLDHILFSRGKDDPERKEIREIP